MPANLKITDTFLIKRVEAERRKRGDKTPTKTARSLISERLQEIERRHEDKSEPVTAAAA